MWSSCHGSHSHPTLADGCGSWFGFDGMRMHFGNCHYLHRKNKENVHSPFIYYVVQWYIYSSWQKTPHLLACSWSGHYSDTDRDIGCSCCSKGSFTVMTQINFNMIVYGHIIWSQKWNRSYIIKIMKSLWDMPFISWWGTLRDEREGFGHVVPEFIGQRNWGRWPRLFNHIRADYVWWNQNKTYDRAS